MFSDRPKNRNLGKLLNISSFQSTPDGSTQQAEYLQNLYTKANIGPAIDYGTWREKQMETPSEIKDFRNSQEYPLFRRQLAVIVQQIKTEFLNRQAAEITQLETPILDELFEPLLLLPKRLLDPRIVTDEKKRQQRAEAELSYTEGKRFLEGILYRVKTAPFNQVASVLKTLLAKQQHQRKTSLSVCAEGTRQHLQSAYFDLSDDVASALDSALLSVLKQYAYEFLSRTTHETTEWNLSGLAATLMGETYHGLIEFYDGVEIHLCATLVNFAYQNLGLIPEGQHKINDAYARAPVTDAGVLVHLNGKLCRAAIRMFEARQFVDELDNPAILKNIVNRLAIRYHGDLQRVKNYEEAKQFIRQLMKLAGHYEDPPEVSVFHKKWFGYYRKVKLPYKNLRVLNEAQLQEINDHGIDEVLSAFKARHITVSPTYTAELNELCALLAIYPEIDRTTVSKNVLMSYEKLIESLCAKSLIKELNSSRKTTDHDILNYVHSQLQQHVQRVSPKRDQMATAAMARLMGVKKSEAYFGIANVHLDIDEGDLSQLNDDQYRSLDQLQLSNERLETVKTPEMIASSLRDFILLLMIKGRHFKAIPFGWAFKQMQDTDAKRELVHFYYKNQSQQIRDKWIVTVNKDDLLSNEDKAEVIVHTYGSMAHALFAAIANENYIDIDLLIRVYGASAIDPLPNGKTPLVTVVERLAASRNYRSLLTIAGYLLSLRASPDQLMPDSVGRETILHHALRMHKIEGLYGLANLLIRENANYYIPDLTGITALNLVSTRYATTYDDQSYTLLKRMFDKDDGRIFERFKDIYFEQSYSHYIHFFDKTMGDYLRSKEINSMTGVFTYMECHPSVHRTRTIHVFETLLRELSAPTAVVTPPGILMDA